MSKEVNDGGPAFPGEAKRWCPVSECYVADDGKVIEGMTLRDYFAGQLLAGLCANPKYGWQALEAPGALAHGVYRAADAMIAKRKRGEP